MEVLMKKKVTISILILCLIFSNITLVLANGGVWNTIDVLVNGMTVIVNGQKIQSDNFLYNGTTYLPLRVVSEALGANVNYIQETKTADITLNSPTTSNNGIDYSSVDIATVYVELEQLSDLINSRQELANSIFRSYVSDYYSVSEMNEMLDDYKEGLVKDNEYINSYIETLDEYLNQFSGNPSMKKDFSLIISYLEDIKKMEVNKINLLKNIVTYGKDDTIIDRFNDLQYAIGDSNYAINDIASSNYFSITNNILNGEAYMPASQVLDYKNSYFITVSTNIEISSANSTYSNTSTTQNAYSFPLHLYSNDGKEYLGKLVTNEYDSDSIWNKYGDYGSKYSTTSIWNTYGDYGSAYSSESAFNEYATKPPKIVDNKGNFIGYLTSNEYMLNGYSIITFNQFLIDNNQ
jgi:hypothetical protein